MLLQVCFAYFECLPVVLRNRDTAKIFSYCPAAASSKYEEGIAKCISILSQLGEVIPTDITADVYVDEVAQVRQLLHGKSREELLSLPMMSGTQQLVSLYKPCRRDAHDTHCPF